MTSGITQVSQKKRISDKIWISILEQIFAKASEFPDKTALTDGRAAVTYRELVQGICSAAETLEKQYGVRKTDKVIVAADRQPEFVLVYFACHMLGATVIPLAPDTNEKRYRLIKEKTAPALVAGYPDQESGRPAVPLKDIVSAGDRPGRPEASGMDHPAFPDPGDTADIMFTTGTTGEPKGVCLSHRNLAAAALNINTFIGNRPEDVEILVLPVSHSFGIGRMRCALSNGQTLVMCGGFASVKRFFRLMEAYKVSGFGMVPAGWALLKKLSGMELGRYKDQLHYIEIGSAPMPLEEKLALSDALPDTRICMHYGLTEASRSAFIEFHSEKDHLDTVGKQSPNTFISIRDENGLEVPAGTEGEICVRGAAVTDGYYDLPAGEVFSGGYFRTGDWGSMDSGGYLTLKSRKKELINTGGRKVSPAEVEEVLYTLDFVKDCACTAVPDPEGILGEVVQACIVTDTPEKVSFEVIDPLIGSRLEGYKHPVKYTVVGEIPRTSSGKVQRLLLKGEQNVAATEII